MRSVITRWAVTAADKATIIRPATVLPKLTCSLAITFMPDGNGVTPLSETGQPHRNGQTTNMVPHASRLTMPLR